MRRRLFIRGTGVAALGLIAGCTSDTDSTDTKTPHDMDGDGVPDEHDYAPGDPDIQSRSDVITETRASTATPTPAPPPTASPTPSVTSTLTPTATSTPTRPNTIQANSGPIEGVTHHADHYSDNHATVHIYGDLLSKSYPDGADLIAAVAGYPGTARSGDVFNTHRSDSFTPPSRGDTTVTVAFNASAEADVPFYYWFALIPSAADESSLNTNDAEFLCETDRLRIRNGDLRRSRHPAEPDDEGTARYSRTAAEGSYTLDFSGTSHGREWTVGFTALKHGYIAALIGQRYTDRRYYVYEALNDGVADELGRILNDEADANGITGARQTVDFLIDFVQNLPYVPDDVSTGYDDYTKRHVESLVDGGGDCEDSSIMLASLLLSDSFGYGTALIFLPGHAALGVKGGDNIDGYYYEKNGTNYYYIETTGRGWDVGEIPDEYRNEEAYVREF